MGMFNPEQASVEAAKKFNAQREAERQEAEKTKGTTEKKLGESTGPFEDLTDEEMEKSARNIKVENPMEGVSDVEANTAVDNALIDPLLGNTTHEELETFRTEKRGLRQKFRDMFGIQKP